MFQFARFAHTCLYIQQVVSRLPYSDISGSMLASSSPELFVGRHVLLRLCVPRYPPLALCSLTSFFLSDTLGFTLLDLPAICFLYAVFKVLTELLLSILTTVGSHGAELTFTWLFQVEVSGLEPLTSCLQSRRSTN